MNHLTILGGSVYSLEESCLFADFLIRFRLTTNTNTITIKTTTQAPSTEPITIPMLKLPSLSRENKTDLTCVSIIVTRLATRSLTCQIINKFLKHSIHYILRMHRAACIHYSNCLSMDVLFIG